MFFRKFFSIRKALILQSRPINRYANILQTSCRFIGIFDFSSVFSSQFSKISQKSEKRNDL